MEIECEQTNHGNSREWPKIDQNTIGNLVYNREGAWQSIDKKKDRLIQ